LRHLDLEWERAVSPEENKKVVASFVEVCQNQHDLSFAAEVFHPQFVNHYLLVAELCYRVTLSQVVLKPNPNPRSASTKPVARSRIRPPVTFFATLSRRLTVAVDCGRTSTA
jgi:hypothetical protein